MRPRFSERFTLLVVVSSITFLPPYFLPIFFYILAFHYAVYRVHSTVHFLYYVQYGQPCFLDYISSTVFPRLFLLFFGSLRFFLKLCKFVEDPNRSIRQFSFGNCLPVQICTVSNKLEFSGNQISLVSVPLVIFLPYY